MIRLASAGDLPEILAIYAPYVRNTTYSFEYEVPSEDAFAARFAEITAQFPWLVWQEGEKIWGYAYASRPFERAGYAWCSEVSIYLKPEAQGKGIGRKLYQALEALLEIQGYRMIYAIITGENKASLSFHEKLGYRLVADFQHCGYKFGRSLNVIWMEKPLNSVGIPSNEPTPFLSIVENHGNLTDILDKITLS